MWVDLYPIQVNDPTIRYIEYILTNEVDSFTSLILVHVNVYIQYMFLCSYNIYIYIYIYISYI